MMNYLGNLAIVTTLCLAEPSLGGEAEAISVRLILPRGRVFVGQAVDATVVAVAGSTPPHVIVGKTEDFSILPLTRVLARPRSMSQIGPMTDSVTEFEIPLRIVPRRPGSLTLPAIRVVAGTRSGVIPPRKLTITAVPTSGRTSTFLGGVGPLAVECEARPSASVRQGEAVEIRVKLDGPGAVGSTFSPITNAMIRVGLGGRIEPLSEESSLDPPSRTFRARIRPTRAGEITLPPIRVSWFDPTSATFQTSVSHAVTLRVVATPEFEAASLSMPGEPISKRVPFAWAAGIAASGLGFAAMLLVWLRWRTARRRRHHPRKMAERLACHLRSIQDPRAIAREATQGMVDLLQQVAHRQSGALTPPEARERVLEITGNPGLADRAGQLIEACDRVLYGEKGAEMALRERAIAVLVDLAGAMPRIASRETLGAA